MAALPPSPHSATGSWRRGVAVSLTVWLALIAFWVYCA
jgi:hypothetical protein